MRERAEGSGTPFSSKLTKEWFRAPEFFVQHGQIIATIPNAVNLLFPSRQTRMSPLSTEGRGLACPGRGPGGPCAPGKRAGKGVRGLRFWQKCVWVGAALVIVMSLLMITRTADTSSPAPTAATGEAKYFTFQDSTHGDTHYAVRDGDRAVIYNSMPAGR